jgi:hypothetical protein
MNKLININSIGIIFCLLGLVFCNVCGRIIFLLSQKIILVRFDKSTGNKYLWKSDCLICVHVGNFRIFQQCFENVGSVSFGQREVRVVFIRQTSYSRSSSPLALTVTNTSIHLNERKKSKLHTSTIQATCSHLFILYKPVHKYFNSYLNGTF